MYYENGKLQAQTQFINGEKNGTEIFYYANGRKQSEATFKANKLNGEYIEYYENGNIKLRVYYENDAVNGTAILYDEKARRIQQAEFVNGVVQGNVITYRADGKTIKETVPYVDGKISGLVETRDRFGNLVTSLDFKDGVFQGSGTGYYENGNPKYKLQPFDNVTPSQLSFDESGTLQTDKLNGLLIIYNENGSKSRELPYRNGILDGTVRTYYSGIEQIDEEQSVKQGKLDGAYTAYDLNGQPYVTANYTNDELDGVVRFYDADGHLTMTIPYIKGEVQGEVVGYYPSGRKLFVQEFKDNSPEGWRKTYYEDGGSYQEKLYHNGIWNGKDYIEYNRDGNKIIELRQQDQRQKYWIYDENGDATDMTKAEKDELLKRIDTRAYEKEEFGKYLNIRKTVGSYFKGSF